MAQSQYGGRSDLSDKASDLKDQATDQIKKVAEQVEGLRKRCDGPAARYRCRRSRRQPQEAPSTSR